MSYLVLARKYRPQTFDQVVEQEHITRTLTHAISSGRVAHAILFSGPRGTGKTTVARILAKAMNCKDGPAPVPCNECRSCNEITGGNAVDVFEIDGASNNSVDQIRELRENIKYMPAHSSYKIYIIDEVHMLSMPAFNALLKTLEEPPAHVLFIFATTEPHKIPVTILSRCQRHDFRRINLNSISRHMARICEQEDFDIGDESLALIAREAGGSMRDALSLLDQLMTCSQRAINHDQVLDILGVIDRKNIFDLSDAILRGDIPETLHHLDEIFSRGHDIKKLYADLLEHFRNLLVVKIGKQADKLLDLSKSEIDLVIAQAKQVSATTLNQLFDQLFREESSVRLSAQPKLALEMAFIRMLQSAPVLPIDVLIDKLESLRQEIQSPRAQKEIPPLQSVESTVKRFSGDETARKSSISLEDSVAQKQTIASEPTAGMPVSDQDPQMIWQQITEIVSQMNPSLAANLSKCRLKRHAENRLEIEVTGNSFTLNMIRREKNMAVLNKVCKDFFGTNKEIVCSQKIDSPNDRRKKKSHENELKQRALSHPLVADAIEIFDGKLVEVKIL